MTNKLTTLQESVKKTRNDLADYLQKIERSVPPKISIDLGELIKQLDDALNQSVID